MLGKAFTISRYPCLSSFVLGSANCMPGQVSHTLNLPLCNISSTRCGFHCQNNPPHQEQSLPIHFKPNNTLLLRSAYPTCVSLIPVLILDCHFSYGKYVRSPLLDSCLVRRHIRIKTFLRSLPVPFDFSFLLIMFNCIFISVWRGVLVCHNVLICFILFTYPKFIGCLKVIATIEVFYY